MRVVAALFAAVVCLSGASGQPQDYSTCELCQQTYALVEDSGVPLAAYTSFLRPAVSPTSDKFLSHLIAYAGEVSPRVACTAVCGAPQPDAPLMYTSETITSVPEPDLGCAMCSALSQQYERTTPATPCAVDAVSAALCEQLANPFAASFCQGYADIFQRAISNMVGLMPAQQACLVLGECAPPSTVTTFKAEPVPAGLLVALGLPAASSSGAEPGLMPQLAEAMASLPATAGWALEDTCGYCKLAVQEVDQFVADPDNQKALEQQAIAACGMMDGSDAQEKCKLIVREYAPMVFALVLEYLQPEPVCEQLGYCDEVWRGEGYDANAVASVTNDMEERGADEVAAPRRARPLWYQAATGGVHRLMSAAQP